MRAGKLRHLVAIQSRDSGQDAAGGQLDTWSALATAYAGPRALSGRELESAQSVNNEISHVWEMRYLSTVTAGMRIVFRSVNYNILWIDNKGFRDREMLVYTSAGLSTG